METLRHFQLEGQYNPVLIATRLYIPTTMAGALSLKMVTDEPSSNAGRLELAIRGENADVVICEDSPKIFEELRVVQRVVVRCEVFVQNHCHSVGSDDMLFRAHPFTCSVKSCLLHAQTCLPLSWSGFYVERLHGEAIVSPPVITISRFPEGKDHRASHLELMPFSGCTCEHS